MKRLAVIALVVAGLVVPAFGQRGGGGHGGGGFGGHAGGGFHSGGFSGSHFAAPSGRYSGGYSAARAYRFAYPRSYTGYSGSRYSSGYRSGFRAPYLGNRRGEFGNDRFRRGFYPGYGFAYPYAIPDWIGLGPIGCDPDAQIYGGGDDFGYFGCDDLSSQADQPVIYGDDGGDAGQPPPPPPDYDQPGPNYQPPPVYEPPAYQAPQASPMPSNQIATTIVFNDGRPSEQIHNYALTQTTLFVLDQQHRDIPLDQINVAETQKVNRASGVSFQVPQ